MLRLVSNLFGFAVYVTGPYLLAVWTPDKASKVFTLRLLSCHALTPQPVSISQGFQHPIIRSHISRPPWYQISRAISCLPSSSLSECLMSVGSRPNYVMCLFRGAISPKRCEWYVYFSGWSFCDCQQCHATSDAPDQFRHRNLKHSTDTHGVLVVWQYVHLNSSKSSPPRRVLTCCLAIRKTHFCKVPILFVLYIVGLLKTLSHCLLTHLYAEDVRTITCILVSVVDWLTAAQTNQLSARFYAFKSVYSHCLDYCNAVLAGIQTYRLPSLQLAYECRLLHDLHSGAARSGMSVSPTTGSCGPLNLYPHSPYAE